MVAIIVFVLIFGPLFLLSWVCHALFDPKDPRKEEIKYWRQVDQEFLREKERERQHELAMERKQEVEGTSFTEDMAALFRWFFPDTENEPKPQEPPKPKDPPAPTRRQLLKEIEREYREEIRLAHTLRDRAARRIALTNVEQKRLRRIQEVLG